MELKEAVAVIKSNWPDERYTMLKEALTVALEHLPTTDNSDYTKLKDALESIADYGGCLTGEDAHDMKQIALEALQ